MTNSVDFVSLHFTDATIRDVKLQGKCLTLQASNVLVMDGTKPAQMLQTCELIFEGVTSSRRTIIPYARSPKINRTLPEQIIADVEGSPSGVLYELEGLLEQPSAWIKEWAIHAASFTLRTPSAT